MVEFEQRKKFRSFIYSKVTLVVLFVALVFVGHSTYNLWLKSRETERGLLVLKNELAELKAKNDNLASRVASLKTDKGIEEAIREKFKVAKEGEGVVVVVDEKGSENKAEVGKTWLRAVYESIKNYFK